MKCFLTIFLLFFCTNLFSQDLVYKPKNPAFGGNPYNSQWLLASAEAQNSFEDPNSSSRGRLSELDRFTQSLNSQLLGQVSRRLFTEQFGSGKLEPGGYTFGSLAVDIYPSNEGLVINILDTSTGEQTQIIIPN